MRQNLTDDEKYWIKQAIFLLDDLCYPENDEFKLAINDEILVKEIADNMMYAAQQWKKS